MQKIQGLSLLEILLAFFLFSLLLLSIDAMQLSVLQKTKAHFYFQIANQQVNNFLEILKITPQPNMTIVNGWHGQVQQSLPQGHAFFHRQQNNFVINLIWGKGSSTCKETQIEVNGCLHFLANVS